MTPNLTWQEIVIRLALAALAGTLVGIDRGEHGRPAGLRTTLMVCLAASVAMIQSNLLLATAGKRADSFASMDPMRLPLGILTGMGFIGGGAILKKGDIVLGVTTAATLWFVTVIGLCFGGGQYALGLCATALALVVLIGLKPVESLMTRDRRAVLTLTAALDGTSEMQIRNEILSRGFHIASWGVKYEKTAGEWTLRTDVRWRERASESSQPPLVKDLAALASVSRVEWCPEGGLGGTG